MIVPLVPYRSLEQAFNFRDEVVGVLTVRGKLNDIAIAVHEVLEEVPLDLIVGALSLHVGVEGASVVALDIDLAEEWEVDSESRSDPIVDLLFLPGLLGTELIARAGQDLEASRTISIMHSLVLAVVRLSDTSLGSDVDDNDGLRTLCKVANGNFLGAADALNEDVKEWRLACHIYLNQKLQRLKETPLNLFFTS